MIQIPRSSNIYIGSAVPAGVCNPLLSIVLACIDQLASVDCIEYDVAIQISAVQHGVCALVSACMCRRNRTGIAACFIDVRV